MQKIKRQDEEREQFPSSGLSHLGLTRVQNGTLFPPRTPPPAASGTIRSSPVPQAHAPLSDGRSSAPNRNPQRQTDSGTRESCDGAFASSDAQCLSGVRVRTAFTAHQNNQRHTMDSFITTLPSFNAPLLIVIAPSKREKNPLLYCSSFSFFPNATLKYFLFTLRS